MFFRKNNSRKDTGYSTASSHTSNRHKIVTKQIKKPTKEISKTTRKFKEKQKLSRTDKDTKGHSKVDIDISEESSSDLTSVSEVVSKKKTDDRKYTKASTVSVSTSDVSSEWRHQLAIMAIFCLYIFIFIFCLVFIYCGINTEGLVIAKINRKRTNGSQN